MKSQKKADPTLPFAPLELDGKSYKLCMNFRAIADAEQAIEDETGKPANLLFGVWNVNARNLPYILRAALNVYHPQTTMADVEAMLSDLDSVALIYLAIDKAREVGSPKEVAGPSDRAKPLTRERGWAWMWTFARVEYGMSKDEFFDELDLRLWAELVERHREKRKRQDEMTELMIAQLCALVGNIRPGKWEALKPQDFMPSHWEDQPVKPKKLTRAQIADKVRRLLGSESNGN